MLPDVQAPSVLVVENDEQTSVLLGEIVAHGTGCEVRTACERGGASAPVAAVAALVVPLAAATEVLADRELPLTPRWTSSATGPRASRSGPRCRRNPGVSDHPRSLRPSRLRVGAGSCRACS